VACCPAGGCGSKTCCDGTWKGLSKSEIKSLCVAASAHVRRIEDVYNKDPCPRTAAAFLSALSQRAGILTGRPVNITTLPPTRAEIAEQQLVRKRAAEARKMAADAEEQRFQRAKAAEREAFMDKWAPMPDAARQTTLKELAEVFAPQPSTQSN
jgi:hypothetical protein